MMRLVATALLVLAGIGAPHAQDFPAKPVRIIIPAVPGGSADASARAIAENLGKRLGQSVVVENRGGAGGAIAATLVLQSPPDGHTLFLAFDGTVVVAPAVQKMPFDTLTDFLPIIKVSDAPLIIVTHPSVPAKTIQELIAQSKLKPGGFGYGSAGTGTTPHLFGELLALRTGASLTHIPYKGGGQALTDVLSGALPVLMTAVATAAQHVKAGKLNGIAVAGSQRVPATPNVPTLAESGLAGFEFGAWFGLMAHSKTPRAIIERVYRDTRAVLELPETKERFTALGLIPGTGTTEQFGEEVKRDLARWVDVVKQAKIKIE
jgi:tripartite-type tricarboxylate transporter receptor subunit TctC